MFGSYAKGTNHTGSDVDLLIIADVGENTDASIRRAHQLAADCYPPVDVVFATPAEVADTLQTQDYFLESILATGVTVYSKI